MVGVHVTNFKLHGLLNMVKPYMNFINYDITTCDLFCNKGPLLSKHLYIHTYIYVCIYNYLW